MSNICPVCKEDRGCTIVTCTGHMCSDGGYNDCRCDREKREEWIKSIKKKENIEKVNKYLGVK